jgi:hypothetical protein
MERGLIRGGNDIPDFLFSACCSTFSSPSVITKMSPKGMVKRLEINIKDMLEMGVKCVNWVVGRVEPLDSFPCFSIATRLCKKKRRVMHESIYKVQGEHKVFPWLQIFITRKLRGIQTCFSPVLITNLMHNFFIL